MKVKVTEVIVGSRFRKEVGDLSSLVESIREVGLLHPIVVNEKRELIAGVRRLEACKKIGWTEVPVHVVPLDELVKGEFHENTVRKDFVASELVAVKRVLGPEVEETRIGHRPSKEEKGAESAPFPRGKTRDVVAKYAGVSHDTLAKAEAIVEAAEKNPEKFGKLLEGVDAGRTSIHYAYKAVKREEAKTEAPPLPEGVFDVILADPPWEYDLPLRGAPDLHYPVMSLEAISALKVPTADDAVLFLWATNPKLEQSLSVMKAWGFTYKTNLVWVKDQIGTGYYFRGQHELLLLGKKGDIPVPAEADRPPSVLSAPRREHSRKPDEVYALIERMYPNSHYLELFARIRREGWVSWGNEGSK